ncbi:hypothetical protein [Arcobacter sp. LA11]|uniref:hypothetical protein n=1 Tax=Arcobacter sp. LA11 TaxID=1898176 RepID=UPI000934DCB7|nr:hypothetical protein [Arcobacter sp. LA11]
MIKQKTQNMKPAYIEQILMWMVLFIGFVWLFFFVINYATAIRIKDNMDALSEYAVRVVSGTLTQSTMPTAQLVTDLNSIRIPAIDTIAIGDIVCNIATAAPQNTNYQAIFIVQGTYNKNFLSGQGANNFISRKVVYNENSAAQITCTLSIDIN